MNLERIYKYLIVFISQFRDFSGHFSEQYQINWSMKTVKSSNEIFASVCITQFNVFFMQLYLAGIPDKTPFKCKKSKINIKTLYVSTWVYF